jgi:3-dehydroquinate synthase
MTMSAAESVRVTHAHGSYDVRIERGALRSLGEHVVRATAAHSCALIADANVAAHYGNGALASLEAAGLRATPHTFPAGERSKTRATWAALTDALLAAAHGRDACVVALGGGVTGDLGGFVAATYLRGVPVVQAPTTLLAMVDASIGGKTGVDTPAGKNLVGAFHAPSVVLVDADVLATLPPAALIEGLAEAVKHAAIADAAQLDAFERDAAALRRGEPAATDALLRASIPIKARVASADPHEGGIRATLNFGHTIAHAIERLTEYAIPHGHAVALGMVAEAAIGEALGVTAAGTADRLHTVCRALGLPHALPDLRAEDIIAATAGDKKSRAAVVRYALLERPGACARADDGSWTHAVEPAVAANVLDRIGAGK